MTDINYNAIIPYLPPSYLRPDLAAELITRTTASDMFDYVEFDNGDKDQLYANLVCSGVDDWEPEELAPMLNWLDWLLNDAVHAYQTGLRPYFVKNIEWHMVRRDHQGKWDLPADYAQRDDIWQAMNHLLGHTDDDLQKALISSFSGDWSWCQQDKYTRF